MQEEPNYKNIKFGTTVMGQTTIFKIRFNSVEDELYKKLKTITLWQETILTSTLKADKNGQRKQKNYFTIVGAFNTNNKGKFRIITQYHLNKRNFNIALKKHEESVSNMNIMELEEKYQKSQMEEWIEESKDWSEYLTPLDEL
jgi:hypothetical protein